MSNENLSNNSVDESISALENSDNVKQHTDSLSANQIQHTKKIDEDFFKDIVL